MTDAPAEGPDDRALPVLVPRQRVPVVPPTVTTALDVSLEIGAGVVHVAGRAGAALRRFTRPVIRIVLSPPGVPEVYHPSRRIAVIAGKGRVLRSGLTERSQQLLRDVIPLVVDAVLDQVDVTSLVLDRVDLESVIAEVDLDAVVARVDFDAVVDRLPIDRVIDRIDLADLANQVIAEIDLPGIIRESSGAMASETVLGVRAQGIEADEWVNRMVDRVLLRQRRRNTQAPVPDPGPAT